MEFHKSMWNLDPKLEGIINNKARRTNSERSLFHSLPLSTSSRSTSRPRGQRVESPRGQGQVMELGGGIVFLIASLGFLLVGFLGSLGVRVTFNKGPATNRWVSTCPFPSRSAEAWNRYLCIVIALVHMRAMMWERWRYREMIRWTVCDERWWESRRGTAWDTVLYSRRAKWWINSTT